MRHPGDLAQNVHAVGVDNGGTWIRLKGLNARGRCVWSLKKPSPTVEKLPSFLKQHLKRFHGTLQNLAIGSRGVWKQAKRRGIKRALHGLAKNIVVMSDVEAAWLAAFSPHPRYAHPLPKGRGPKAVGLLPEGEGGRRPDEGIIVISGTGSIAYGRSADGKSARAGGLGPEKGDEGSGYWIGRQWRHHYFASPPQGERVKGEGASAVRKIASLAPVVITKAKGENRIAGEIIREAQCHLAELVVQLMSKLNLRDRIPLTVSGSVLENEWFRSGFFDSLRQKGIKFLFVRKKNDQAIAPLTHALPLTTAGPQR